jgi:hypothetical protein
VLTLLADTAFDWLLQRFAAGDEESRAAMNHCANNTSDD